MFPAIEGYSGLIMPYFKPEKGESKCEKTGQQTKKELHLGATALPLIARENAREFRARKGEPCLRDMPAWTHFKSSPTESLIG